jgi:hypothetical protein
MPTQITGHSDGVVIMIAEKAADIIKEDYHKPQGYQLSQKLKTDQPNFEKSV